MWRRHRFVWPVLLVLLIVILLVRVISAPFSLPLIDDIIKRQFSAQVPNDEYQMVFEKAGIQLKYGWMPTVLLDKVGVVHLPSGAQVDVERIQLSWYTPSIVSRKPALELLVERPNIQLVQDYSGVRLARVEFDDPDAGEPIIRLQSESDTAPSIKVTNDGVVSEEEGAQTSAQIKSDNAWAIESVESLERVFALFAQESADASFRTLEIQNANLEVVDRIYQLYRQLDDVDVKMESFGADVQMDLEFSTGGRRTFGEMLWQTAEPQIRHISGKFENIDLALVLPFLDDQDGLIALKGGTNMSFDVDYGVDGVEHGAFGIDISQTQASIQGDLFEVEGKPAQIEWFPRDARYVLAPFAIRIGQSSSLVDGEFLLGLDNNYGPTLGYSMRLRDTYLRPNDLDAPSNVLDEITVSGWSAPLYGAMGIDKISFRDDQMELDGQGRIDVLQKGLGFDLTLFGKGASADDLKRIWPYFLATEARAWFVQNVSGGRIEEAKMRFNFPVGTVGKPGEDRRIPAGGVSIEGTANNVELIPLPGFPTIEIVGTTNVSVKDHYMVMGFDKALVRDDSGEVVIENAAYLNKDSGAKEQLFEISGQLKGSVSTLVSIANKEPLNLLKDFDVEYRPEDLEGEANVQVIATVSRDEGGKPKGLDYTLNGTVADFTSKFPIEGHVVSDGAVQFTASQSGYRIAGRANIDGLGADILVLASDGGDPVITASATLTEADRKSLGLDLSQFIEGPLRIVGRPSGETIQLAVDLSDARVKFAELGIDKKKGTNGQLNATLLLDGDLVDAQTLDMRFGKVRVAGSLKYDMKQGLLSADIVDLVLNEGDRASVSLVPIDEGFAVEVIGEQLDLKPMLKRFLGLGETASGKATSNAKDQIIDIKVKLDRALGFYKTTAFGVNAHLRFKGADFIRVDLQASLGNAKVVSIATNPLNNGRSMSAASNDLGTLLRFIGMYSQLLNGDGSLVLNLQNTPWKVDGAFVLNEFSIVDEDRVAQVMGNHKDSRALIQRENRVNFKRGEAKFEGANGVITISDGALDGGTIGGTLRGNILTNTRQYDLVGTYIPLFGLNNIFQKLPLFGKLLGGRDGEGLIGVTFAIRGDLDNPKFSINPASILAPGVFRRIFEFKAKGGDAEAKKALEAVDAQTGN
ncbi:AsmA-like C-terminal domain-containing protein [uncultured Maritalea sp.]|uniref:AsmA-like C-terminal domain-containing protein n=1 Tax=uncultured Maritalea sp. TaxID=757249 RepID=UPI00261DA048|nr:AsmA-like C-terminal domain-containing protein [uncultured Maritalea sp.]